MNLSEISNDLKKISRNISARNTGGVLKPVFDSYEKQINKILLKESVAFEKYYFLAVTFCEMKPYIDPAQPFDIIVWVQLGPSYLQDEKLKQDMLRYLKNLFFTSNVKLKNESEGVQFTISFSAF